MTKARDISRYGLGVGIQSAGSVIAGVGITQLNFIGSAVTSIIASVGIATINLVAGGGGGTPGGSQGQVQYNNSSTFAGSSNFTFDGSNVNVGGSLTATTVNSTWSRVGSGLTFTTGIGTNLNVSGVVTTTQLVSTNVNVTGVSTATAVNSTWSQVGSGLTFTTGIGTFANISGILTAANLNVTGIGTVGNIALRSTGASGGIITATAGVVTYFGDGSQLTGLSAGVAISTNTTNRDQYLTYSVAATASTTGLGVTTTKLVYNPGLNYLGIGTTSAKAPLHVVDNILVSAGVASTTDFRIKSYSVEQGAISFEDFVDQTQYFSITQDLSKTLFAVNDSSFQTVFGITTTGIASCPNGFTSGIGSAAKISVSGSNLVFTVAGIGSTSFKLS